ncbi:hypothetical protein [Streptomyces sp. NPDC102360]|uniref:hypothetical protein n=1 Tax=Streptomyces sp. NPDC102360 TaxID=3366160 RepID=UPI00382A8317
MARSRTIVNRLALALAGTALIAVATTVLLLRTRWASHSPDALVTPTHLTALREKAWWTPTAMTASIAATALFATWCVRQIGDGRRRSTPLPVPRSALRTRALEDAVAVRAGTTEGIDRCSARVRARRGRLDVLLRVRLRADTAPAAVLPALTAVASDTRATARPHECTVRVHFGIPGHRASRLRQGPIGDTKPPNS